MKKINKWPDTSTYSYADKAQLILSGENYFTKLEKLIESAKEELHLQFYIFDNDSTGQFVAGLLKKAAVRGVSIFIIVDSVGSSSLPDEFIHELEQAGIKFRKHNPVISARGIRLGRRLHQKIAVADRQRALVGGINIADKYRGADGVAPWLDFAVYIEGEVCKDIARLCTHIWKKRKSAIRFYGKKWVRDGIPVKLQLNDIFRRRAGISRSYKQALRYSQTSVTIVASYFLPGIRMRSYIKKATRRGVEVNIILPGISDVAISKAATTHLYRFLIRHHINIYEWKHSILHGKIAIADTKWVTIGSYNLNHLSEYSSIELNVDIADKAFAESVSEKLEEITKKCDRIDNNTFYNNQSVFTHLKNWFAYRIVRMLFNLVFLFTGKEK